MTDQTQEETTGLFLRLLDTPLYEPIELWDARRLCKDLRLNRGRFDRYCPQCNDRATWGAFPSKEDVELEKRDIPGMGMTVTWMSRFTLRAACTRNHHPVVLYLDALDADKLVKIGQYPSMTDFQLGDLAGFEDAMSKPQRKDFVRAINTGAHGFNVAACVYYRRVFESVLDEARAAHMQQNGLTEWPEYQKAFTPEKIKLLAGQLPPFMVSHPEIYSILSKGVHELSESECGQVLPLLRSSIEMIMKKRKEVADAAKQEALIKQQLAQFQSRR